MPARLDEDLLQSPPNLGPSELLGDIPGGATLNFDVEVMSVDEAAPEPNLFADLDVSPKDGKLSPEEVLAHFQKQDPSVTKIPDGLMEQEDKDKDGFITWEEFGGPKGTAPPKDEL